MAFVLNSIIRVTEGLDTFSPPGKQPVSFAFRSCEKVVIRKSIYSAAETCEIFIPAHYRIRRKGELKTQSIQDARGYKDAFKDGSKVTVQLGYNGKYKQEFVGFIRRTDVSNPSLIIYCEGYIYQLDKMLDGKEFINSDYKEILKYIVAGTDIVLSSKMDGITFNVNRYTVKPERARQALKTFSDTYLLSVFMKDNILFAGLQYGFIFNTVKYAYGTDKCNVVEAKELKKHDGENVQIKVNIIGGGRKKSEMVRYSMGDNTSNIITKHLRNVTDLNALQRYAEAYLLNEKYDGYEGRIETMGLPFAQHGDTADYFDNIYGERSGKYVINYIEIEYSTQGFIRNIGLGYNATKLNKTI